MAETATILVVDDDPGHRALIQRNLIRCGVRNPIVQVGSGDEALDYVFSRGVYAGESDTRELLMLLDVNMPGINGVELLRTLKSDPVKKKIPVIILTTAEDPREIDRCYELGCSIYVTKPVDPGEFVEAIRRLGMLLSIVRAPRWRNS